MDQGLCREVDPDLFFPENSYDSLVARRVCQGCDVKVPCLEYAMGRYVEGVWGGTTLAQRMRMKRAAHERLAS